MEMQIEIPHKNAERIVWEKFVKAFQQLSAKDKHHLHVKMSRFQFDRFRKIKAGLEDKATESMNIHMLEEADHQPKSQASLPPKYCPDCSNLKMQEIEIYSKSPIETQLTYAFSGEVHENQLRCQSGIIIGMMCPGCFLVRTYARPDNYEEYIQGRLTLVENASEKGNLSLT